MFAPRMPAETIGRLWTMLANSQATALNQSKLVSSLEVSTPAVTRYIDLLVDLLLVRRLRPWSGDIGKRLVRTPKVCVRDSGLTHALLDLETWEQVLGHPVAGASWEGFAVENLIAVAGDRCEKRRATWQSVARRCNPLKLVAGARFGATKTHVVSLSPDGGLEPMAIPGICGNGHLLTPRNLKVDDARRRWRCRRCGQARASEFCARHKRAA